MSTITKRTDPCEAEHEVFQFTLILTGITAIDEPVENALFEAGCDDALFGMQDGQAYLAFDRAAESLEKAVLSAIHQVEGCGQNIRVAKVVPPGKSILNIINSFIGLRDKSKALATELLREIVDRK